MTVVCAGLPTLFPSKHVGLMLQSEIAVLKFSLVCIFSTGDIEQLNEPNNANRRLASSLPSMVTNTDTSLSLQCMIAIIVVGRDR